MPHLHLLTLGVPLLLTDAGEQVKFRTRKHFALLLRLAVEAGRRFTRDYLTDLLWADAPDRLASHSLAQAITVLKAKVGREHVLIQKATVALVEGAVDADVAHLDGCEVEIRGRFLDGFDIPGAASFEQWKDEWSAKLIPKVRDCLVKQMDGGRRIGDFATVERHAQVLYELDPLSEDAVRGLIEARAWVGDRSNALKAYGRFEARLAEELGAKPSADLARIAGLLREGRRAAPRPQEADAPQALTARFEAETLIGREKDFAALYDAWLDVRRCSPRIVALLGDPGIGKTTLTNGFVSTCQMEGAVVARAQAYDAERDLPFAVLAELVKQLTMQRAIGSADPDALSELSRVSPEIFSVFPGVPKPVEWSAEVTPLRLADAFLKAITAAAEESPVVVVVDDIHAADNSSAAILHVVARKIASTRVLLILAGRTSELRNSTAPAALTSDTSIEGLRTLELEPLSAEAAARLVAGLAVAGGAQRGALPAERILRASRGNPLAIELLTREWAVHGPESLLRDLEALDTLPAATLGIPRAIRTVFERQAQRLDGRTRAVLDLAAMLGRRLADLALYEAVDCPPGKAAEALSRLREDGLLREVRGDLEFRNELIRAQAYYAVAGPARQHLHRRVAELLAGRASREGESLKLEIAWHYLRGCHPAPALRYAIQGAEEALKAGAPYEAEQILKALLRDYPSSTATQRIRLMLANSLLDQSKAEAALPVLDALMSSSDLSGREEAETARMNAVAVFLLNREPGLRHCQEADRALLAAQKTNDAELIALALFEVARSGVEAGDEDRVNSVRHEVEVLLKEPVNSGLHMAHYARAFCDYYFDDIRSAAACLERTIDVLSQTTRNAVGLQLAYNGLGICLQELCEPEAAYISYAKGLDLALKMGDDSRASIISSNFCGLMTQRGDYDRAVEFGLQSIRLGTRSLNQPRLHACYSNLADVYMLSGKQEKALDCLKTAREWIGQERRWAANVDFLCSSASIALMMGNTGSALQLTSSAEQLAWKRERAVPSPGPFEKLRVFRAAHVSGPDVALAIATTAKSRFRDKRPLHYLDALAATAWLEKRLLGCHSQETEKDLAQFERLEIPGKRHLLEAQGFLP